MPTAGSQGSGHSRDRRAEVIAPIGANCVTHTRRIRGTGRVQCLSVGMHRTYAVELLRCPAGRGNAREVVDESAAPPAVHGWSEGQVSAAGSATVGAHGP